MQQQNKKEESKLASQPVQQSVTYASATKKTTASIQQSTSQPTISVQPTLEVTLAEMAKTLKFLTQQIGNITDRLSNLEAAKQPQQLTQRSNEFRITRNCTRRNKKKK